MGVLLPGGCRQGLQLPGRQARRLQAGVPDGLPGRLRQLGQLPGVGAFAADHRHLIAGLIAGDRHHSVRLPGVGGKVRVRPIGVAGEVQDQVRAVVHPHRRQARGVRCLRRLAAQKGRQRHTHRRQQHHDDQRHPVRPAFQQLRQGEAVHLTRAGQVTHRTHPPRFPRKSREGTAPAG